MESTATGSSADFLNVKANPEIVAQLNGGTHSLAPIFY